MSSSEVDHRSNIALCMRKSVENLVISSQDAIGQSISQALSFSGAITHQATQIASQEHRNVSRSPSPCRRSAEPTISESNDNGLNEKTDVQTTWSAPTSEPPSAEVPLRSSTSPPTARGGDTTRSKKKSWYSAFYPTYKSRSEDFKRLFKDLPDEERLIVDYSCALQKDILAHGRLYASQNFLCFYANIFGWETFLSLKWKDVTAITKEKTAIVIPNAILVCTEGEKHFLASFAGRDKAYLMLFRIWQNALMDQQMTSQDIWQWVQVCYGDDLGFNSDDEEYSRDIVDEDKLSIAEDFLETSGEHKPPPSSSPVRPVWGRSISEMPNMQLTPPVSNGTEEATFDDDPQNILPTDMSDSTESDHDKPAGLTVVGPGVAVLQCPAPHDGRVLLTADLSLHIDQLFTMLFTNSKFCLELLASRKTSDYIQTSWKHDPETGHKRRQVSYTMALSQAVGPKSTHVTENQIMHASSTPGQLYSIDITSTNAGVPYADSFYVTVHYCLQRRTQDSTRLQIYGAIKYKKTVWGIVKGLIEKSTWNGLEDYCLLLEKALVLEAEGDKGTGKRKGRRRRRCTSASSQETSATNTTKLSSVLPAPVIAATPRATLKRTAPRARLDATTAALLLAALLLALNIALYAKLWWRTDEELAGARFPRIVMPDIAEGERMNEELVWTRSTQLAQLQRWKSALAQAITLLQQTEAALSNLLEAIRPTVEKAQSQTPSPVHTEM